jgi:hypothetical protein
MLLLIAAVLLVFLMSMTTYEHMTNKDLMSALKNYGTEDKKHSKKKEEVPPEAPIYGPKVAPVQHPSPSSSKNGGGGSGVYPEIYGPDVVATPGEKIKHSKPGKHESDTVEDDTYDYNPDLQNAFPTSGPPQPFLADFSKFQK